LSFSQEKSCINYPLQASIQRYKKAAQDLPIKEKLRRV
jgi:hypothetical protein